jgi:hypothetical protein
MKFHVGMLLLALVSSCVSRPETHENLPEQPVPFGTVMVDAGRREVIMTGYVNQVEGALELLACGPGGKTHESALVMFADPHDIQAALLLLGLRHGPPMSDVGKGPPLGDRVTLTVTWELDGETRSVGAETFLYDIKTRRVANHGGWIFNGSVTEGGRFKAREEESFITTYWDPWAIINLEGEIGADDERISVNRKTIPPLHTPVRLIVRPEGKR